MPKTTNITNFANHFDEYINAVVESSETLIVKTGKGRGVAIISLDEYNSIQATEHEFKSKRNIERLDASIEQHRLGKGFQKRANRSLTPICK